MRNLIEKNRNIFVFHVFAFRMKIEPDIQDIAEVNVSMSLLEVLSQSLLGPFPVN